MEVEKLGSVCPVTALCVYEDNILAGCGSQVQVFHRGTSDMVASYSALSCRTIHGFCLGPLLDGKKCVCVFGAKCARILYLGTETYDSAGKQTEQCGIRLDPATDVREFEDWIWDAIWLQNDTQWTVALALAHNIVLHWDWLSGTILHKVTCVENCILYCSHLIGSTWSNLVLAAGTVFNQVVIWSADNGDENSDVNDEARPVLHRLTGHQGVIFSICYHAGLQRICSASDDRSIILYQLCPYAGCELAPESRSVDWKHVTIDAMMTLFGHSGRVWDVVLLSDHFLSVGEDAYCIVWNYNGEILQKHKGHKGQSIWSMAASEDESFVVTGGGDSSVRLLTLQQTQQTPGVPSHLTLPHHLKRHADDFVRSLVLWDYDTVVLTTNAGSLLCYTVSTNAWLTLPYDANFSSYSTMAVSPGKSYLAVGSITGHVRILHKQQKQGQPDIRSVGKTSLHKGKICGLTWVEEDYILTTGLHGHCVLAKVQLASEEHPTSVVAQLELPPCKQRWLVSGCLLLPSSSSSPSSCTGMGIEAHLICGDKSGSVHSYQITVGSSDIKAEEVLLPSQTFRKIHGSAGVTCVCSHGDTVYTAGRDGHYRCWTLTYNKLQLLNSSRVFKGFEWIDHLWIGQSRLYVLGFYSSKFVVWDGVEREVLLEVECGGGHRAWDCCLSQGQSYRFVFIKAREVAMVTRDQRSTQTVVKSPLHGMKVWDLKCIFTHTDSRGGVHHIMCTGSEDTTLSLGTLHSDYGKGNLQWTGQHTLHGHLSSVRTLATVPSCGNYGDRAGLQSQHLGQTHMTDLSGNVCTRLNRPPNSQSVSKLVFSAGGRAQIQAWRVSADHNGCPRLYQSSSGHGSQGKLHNQTKDLEDKCSISKKMADKTTVGEVVLNSELAFSGVNSPKISPEHGISAFSCSDGVSDCSQHNLDLLTTRYEHLGRCFLGESRHKRSHKPWKTRYLKLDPETRIMSLSAVTAHQLDSRLPPSLHLLAAAGSDGMLRLFLFDEMHGHFSLLCQSSHHDACILKVLIHLHPYVVSSQNDSCPRNLQPVLLSAATDGRIAVWDLCPLVDWLLTNSEQLALNGQRSGPLKRVGVSADTDTQNSGHSTSLSEKLKEVGQSITTDNSRCQGEAVTSTEGHGDDAENEKDDDDNDDEEESAEAASHSAVSMLNMTRNQYVGDMPSLLSVQHTPSSHSEETIVKEWIPCQEIVGHQSGVNSLHVKSFPDGTLILASGGDDNGLTVHELKCVRSQSNAGDSLTRGGPLFAVTKKAVKLDAHAAQITGTWVLSSNYIVTASIDQRVNLWCLNQQSELALESCSFVDLADVSNMDVWLHQDEVYIGLCGEGVALLSVIALESQEKGHSATGC